MMSRVVHLAVLVTLVVAVSPELPWIPGGERVVDASASPSALETSAENANRDFAQLNVNRALAICGFGSRERSRSQWVDGLHPGVDAVLLVDSGHLEKGSQWQFSFASLPRR
jgi:hypothetical protein